MFALCLVVEYLLEYIEREREIHIYISLKVIVFNQRV